VEVKIDDKAYNKMVVFKILHNSKTKEIKRKYLEIQKIETLSFYELFSDLELAHLENYAPRLFNTYTKPKKLKEIMFEWVLLFYDYHVQTLKEIYFKIGKIDELYKSSPIPYKKHKITDQERSFQNHITDLFTDVTQTPKSAIIRNHEKRIFRIIHRLPNSIIWQDNSNRTIRVTRRRDQP
jgi:hypothetical protein